MVVTTTLLRTMIEVGANPLEVGHNFATREILLHHVVEQANIYGVCISIDRSNSLQFSAKGKHFHVLGSLGKKKGWKVNHITLPNSDRDVSPPQDNVPAVPPPQKDGNDDDAAVGIGDRKGDACDDIDGLA
jgi:hypothetical protein